MEALLQAKTWSRPCTSCCWWVNSFRRDCRVSTFHLPRLKFLGTSSARRCLINADLRKTSLRHQEEEEEEEEDEADRRLLVFAQGAAALRDGPENPKPKFWEVAADPYREYEPIHSSDTGSEGCDEGTYLIWNRESYDGISCRIEELLGMGYRRFIILGTAGIGKSWFAVVWVLKLAINWCKVILKQGAQFHILDFSEETPLVSGPHEELHPLIQSYLSKFSAWLVIDGKQEVRLPYRCKILVACSTKATNFEEFRKHPRACTLYMPAWRQDELKKFLEDFEPYREQYSSMGVNNESDAMKTFQLLGGVPRYVLNAHQTAYGEEKLVDAANALAVDIDTAIQTLSGRYVKDTSDRILHIFTSPDYSKARYEFASPYVTESLRRQFLTANEVRVASLLVCTYDKANLGVLWGLCFEVQVHRLLVAGGVYRIKRVFQGGCGETTTVTIPPHTLQEVDNLEAIKSLAAPGVYLLPMKPNFASVDALLGLTFVQAFKRKTGDHGYKVAGLVKLDSQLQLSKYELWSCVPPELFDVTGNQVYLNAHGNLYKGTDKATLRVLEKCEQFVVEIDYQKLASS